MPACKDLCVNWIVAHALLFVQCVSLAEFMLTLILLSVLPKVTEKPMNTY